jgi:hypothetical protein
MRRIFVKHSNNTTVMKTILFSLSVLCFTSVVAQESEAKPLSQKPSTWKLGWVYSPEVSYRILTEGDQADGLTEFLIDLRDDAQQAKFGQSFSLFGGYQLSKTFSIEAGIGYTDFGDGRKSIDLASIADPTTVIATVKGSNHLHVATIPVSIHVNLGGNKVKGFISAGIAPGMMMRYTTRSYFDYSDGSTRTQNSYSASQQGFYTKFILGAHISGGVEYHYNNKASLRIAPVFRMTTNSVFSDDEINGHYFNAGIEIGTVYKL